MAIATLSKNFKPTHLESSLIRKRNHVFVFISYLFMLRRQENSYQRQRYFSQFLNHEIAIIFSCLFQYFTIDSNRRVALGRLVHTQLCDHRSRKKMSTMKQYPITIYRNAYFIWYIFFFLRIILYVYT